ncbi:MAG: ABC transporter substrate-binding protein [Gammaproteobacteria bacterium]|nr:ABC transporter substrate-binding protein [Gammaproteobacteria bacterium]
MEIGRRIYEDGVLPGGDPLVAMRPEGFLMKGEYAACVICHRRSGMGSVEGNVSNTVLIPPIAGTTLFAGARFSTVPLDPSHHYIPNAAWERALTRGAYDMLSLSRALRDGVDPDGRQLVAPMPRYDLDDVAFEALGAYLSQLNSEPDPGVESDFLHLATVVTDDARPGHVEAVLGVLREWSDFARGSGMPWRLHVWELSGAAETWMSQLENYYRKRPVFALLSGVGAAEWGPVHRYCEQNRIPCVLPSVEVAPFVGDDWYSVYYSPGVGLEVGILSEFLSEGSVPLGGDASIIQLYSDESGRYAAGRLSEKLQRDGVAVNRRRFHTISPRATMKGVSAADVLVLWMRPDEIMQLVTELPEPPVSYVFVSALLAAPEELQLPEAWKHRVRFVSLFDDLGLQGELARLRLEQWLDGAGQTGPPYRRLQADAYAAGNLFNDALGKIRKQEIRRPVVPLNREHVLETLEKLIYKYSDSTNLINIESHVAWYGRMSLGARQRVAVRGGTILRYATTGSEKLVPVSNRIVP